VADDLASFIDRDQGRDHSAGLVKQIDQSRFYSIARRYIPLPTKGPCC
jgi:hypothetical protein